MRWAGVAARDGGMEEGAVEAGGSKLYTWIYYDNYHDLLMPHPMWRNVAPDIAFLASHGVRGVFAEGTGTYPSVEMVELKAWVFAQLTFDPRRNRCSLKYGGKLLPLKNTSAGMTGFNCTGGCAGPGPGPGPFPPTPSGPPVAVKVDVDVSAGGATPFPPYWKRSFGSGHAALTLRADWQAGDCDAAVQTARTHPHPEEVV